MHTLHTPKKKPTPFAFIENAYREPTADDPIRRWLPHPAVARCICRILGAQGIPECDMEDALQDVYVKALAAFGRGKAVPADLRGMKNLCAAIARNYVIDELREAAARERDGDAGLCEDADEHTPLEYGAQRRDAVDARRQLEVVARLFREGAMPDRGLEILEGVAWRCTYAEIGAELGIDAELVRWRMREMCRIYRTRMAKLGMWPGMRPLRAVVSKPLATSLLRKAA